MATEEQPVVLPLSQPEFKKPSRFWLNWYWYLFIEGLKKALRITEDVRGPAEGFFMTGLFTLASDLRGIAHYLKSFGPVWIFPLAFAFQGLANLIVLWDFLFAANRHATRLASVVYQSVMTVGVWFAVFGAKIMASGAVLVGAGAVAAIAAPLVFATIFVSLALIGVAKALVYHSKMKEAEKKGDTVAADFYRGERFKNNLRFVVGAMFLGALTATMIVAPYIPLAVGTTVALIGVTTIASIITYTLVNKYVVPAIKRALQKDNNVTHEPQNQAESLNNNNDTLRRFKLLKPEKEVGLVSKWHHNTIELLRPLPKEAAGFGVEINRFSGIIDNKKTALQDQINNQPKGVFRSFVWNENPKREQKIAALGFIQAAIKHAVDNPAADTIRVGDFLFNLQKPADAIQEIRGHILASYPKAFQSFFQETGDVEACVERGLRMIEMMLQDNTLRRSVSSQQNEEIEEDNHDRATPT